MHSQPVAEHVPGNHHVGFHSIHGEPVHAKELGQEGVPVALHDELGKGREGQHCQTEPTPDSRARLLLAPASITSWGYANGSESKEQRTGS